MYYKLYPNITVLFALACSISATVTGFKHHNEFPELKYFYLYPLASFLQMTICGWVITTEIDGEIIEDVSNVGTNVFLLIEFLLIYNFFRQVLKSRVAKHSFHAIAVVYIIFLCSYWAWTSSFTTFTASFYIQEACAIIIPGCFYFFESFKYPSTQNLMKEPSFWITTGIFFHFSCTLPIFLLKDFMYNEHGYVIESNLYSISFICYGILFLFITKAYLCPKIDTP